MEVAKSAHKSAGYVLRCDKFNLLCTIYLRLQ